MPAVPEEVAAALPPTGVSGAQKLPLTRCLFIRRRAYPSEVRQLTRQRPPPRSSQKITESGTGAEVVSYLEAYWARAGFWRNSGDLGSDWGVTGYPARFLEASQQDFEKKRQNLANAQQF